VLPTLLNLCISTEQVKQQYPNLVMVDYTLPDVIHDMANLYIKHKAPFVMGVSGAAADVPWNQQLQCACAVFGCWCWCFKRSCPKWASADGRQCMQSSSHEQRCQQKVEAAACCWQLR
jgi:hypothetical protein